MKKTGLLDRNNQDIYEDEVIIVGMRVDDPKGWTEERVVRKPKPAWKFWQKTEWELEHPSRPQEGRMQMQRDQKLRQKLSNL